MSEKIEAHKYLLSFTDDNGKLHKYRLYTSKDVLPEENPEKTFLSSIKNAMKKDQLNFGRGVFNITRTQSFGHMFLLENAGKRWVETIHISSDECMTLFGLMAQSDSFKIVREGNGEVLLSKLTTPTSFLPKKKLAALQKH